MFLLQQQDNQILQNITYVPILYIYVISIVTWIQLRTNMAWRGQYVHWVSIFVSVDIKKQDWSPA